MSEFKVGDVVRCVCEVSIHHNHEGPIEDVKKTPSGTCYQVAGTSGGWFASNLALVRRASQPQREGGFSVGQRVRVFQVKEGTYTDPSWVGEVGLVVKPEYELGPEHRVVDFPRWGTARMHVENLEPAAPAPAQPVVTCEHCDGPHYGAQCPVTYPEQPPQPAPMTRAARVLQGMERDPYNEHGISGRQRRLDEDNIADMTSSHSRNEAARLRMARMSLDRPLDAEQARWERLVTARVPVGRR